MKLNEKLIKLRKENGLSQEEFGDKINVSRQAISKWELGKTTPDVDKIKEITKVFNLDFNYLLKMMKIIMLQLKQVKKQYKKSLIA